jgi:subtilisin family serine protease
VTLANDATKEFAMQSNAMTSRSILALVLCGLLLAVCCIDESSPAAARGGFGRMGGGRMGGGRGFGGGSQHQMSHSTGRTNQYSTTNRNSTNSGSNKTGTNSSTKTTNTPGTVNNSNANTAGANSGSKTTNTTGNTSTSNTSTASTGSRTTNTQGTGNTSTANTSTTSTGSRTTNTQGTGNTSTANTSTANTSTTSTGSKSGNAPGTVGDSTSTSTSGNPGSGTGRVTVGTTGTNTPDPPGGGARVPGSQMPNLPLPAVGLGTAGAGGVGGGGGIGGTAAGANVAGSGVPPRSERRYVPDEVITEFSSTATPQSIDLLARRYNLTRLESQAFSLIGVTIYRWHINGRRSVPDTIGAIEDQRIVARVQPNYLFALQEDAPRVSARTRGGDSPQYALGKLQIERAHQVATGKNVAIAVIDSEIDMKHPDLQGTIAKSFDALGGDETPQSHGTAMAGAIAAHGKLSGTAVGPQLLAARAFDNTAGGAKATSFAIYKSLQWAADNGARVINMSFAGPADPNMHRMLTAAYDKGIVLVAAAGNAGPNSAPLYPAVDPDVIAVTATDSNDGLFKMANRGSYIAVAAPGVEILALAPGDSYQVTTGTSVAAAHVSGIAAMLLEENPSLTPAAVRSIIMSTAKPLGSGGQQTDFGAGLADAYQAVTSLNGKPPGKEDAEQAKE